MRAKESCNRYLMRLSEQFLELVIVFKEASENFIIIYFKTRQAKRTDLIFFRPLKNIHLVTQSF
jgi:hypothetical protein